MLTGKQRSYLKSLAHNLDPLFQLGKNGLSDNFIKEVDVALENRELVKINILNNNMLEAEEVSRELVETLGAEFVQNIGNKVIIYRESEENKEINLPK
ncbi:ribosome assembly RNA-binding protein YhbY [Tissierella creatinophila]|uniref:RNA-binding protein YhbY n=1 Tax=Tissierella creatinophila DSM 6911 TaxID=1123403 RepID=A0A1U7M808_TISCR|nr:ribosome assembly RNA-binding protein YhbY [Tissierella creatinophila]OLS03338.1 RNA-binding protein YhbY [Tissierella creatinophila DSM 6911]